MLPWLFRCVSATGRGCFRLYSFRNSQVISRCLTSRTIYVFWTLYYMYQLLQKTFYCTDSKITVFEITDTKTPPLLMWKCINWLRIFFTRTRGWEFYYSHGTVISSPSHDEAGRGISAKSCGLDDVFPPDDFGSGPYIPFIIYIRYMIAAI